MGKQHPTLNLFASILQEALRKPIMETLTQESEQIGAAELAKVTPRGLPAGTPEDKDTEAAKNDDVAIVTRTGSKDPLLTRFVIFGSNWIGLDWSGVI